MNSSDIHGRWKLQWVGSSPENPALGDENKFQGILVLQPDGILYTSVVVLNGSSEVSPTGYACAGYQYANPERNIQATPTTLTAGFYFSYNAYFTLIVKGDQFFLRNQVHQATFLVPPPESILLREAAFNSKRFLTLLVDPNIPEYWVWSKVCQISLPDTHS